MTAIIAVIVAIMETADNAALVLIKARTRFEAAWIDMRKPYLAGHDYWVSAHEQRVSRLVRRTIYRHSDRPMEKDRP
ncbi:MAG: hypothetical protein KYX67_02965 [Brevundimonas sp.]|uniref:Uncharacterized protein n=1 Tax=Brevundimonas mediterranea TaxID=74329 RepID=A0A7W6A414_9CAUL|nr:MULTISPECIES: hypothetical protein [Brevundimonas]MBB3871370.1 hypothetical protein [Brevundimonas mediterranea]MDK2746263.1 hypothetical protein [Brevundimonas sp.]